MDLSQRASHSTRSTAHFGLCQFEHAQVSICSKQSKDDELLIMGVRCVLDVLK